MFKLRISNLFIYSGLIITFFYILIPHILGNEDNMLTNYLTSTSNYKGSYQPEMYILAYPKLVISKPVVINVEVFDELADIENATLSYSINNSNIWENIKMTLIDGTLRNGTFAATIPSQKENTTVKFKIYIKDSLNNSNSHFDEEYQVDNHKIIDESLDFVYSNEPIVSTYILDKENDVRKVTLFYTIDKNQNDTIEMSKVRKIEDISIFTAKIPDLSGKTLFKYNITSVDDKGHHDNITNKYPIKKYKIDPEKRKNIFWINAKDLIFNTENMNAEIKINYEIMDINTFASEPSNVGYEIVIANADMDPIDELAYFPFTLSILPFSLPFPMSEDDNIVNKILVESFLSLIPSKDHIIKTSVGGDTLRYPFDNYHLNLIHAIPFKNTSYNYSHSYEEQINDDWITKSYAYIDKSNTTYNFIKQGRTEYFPQDRITNYTLLNIKFDFFRTFTIAIIIVPLIAIFYLLGSIFIFENTSDNISNRLTLTLGIFALLFTLPEIIDSMKPQTTGPTIADSMLSIIIIATIAFTISSIISSSSTIQKWFPKHHTWIDGIVFIIVSGFVIVYFNNYLFDNEIWWLVPIILFGLGYGLLLRAVGIKINKPLMHFFKEPKKKDI